LTTILSSDPKLLVIDNMKSEFGKRETVGYAKVYESEEREKAVESSHILLRNFPPADDEKAGESEVVTEGPSVESEEEKSD
ncbi:MAG: 30S ribosomal protein S24e, partial [Halobacteriota archaeon]|nr:30S ribosomal protein S24e [Halobacteriota archaeon]